MSKNHKVVSFERSAEYLHHRAMMNRRDNRIVDALELMRQAVEASPENSEYRLDLAELYCEMGCHGQSTRLLLDMLSEQDAPDECYYGLALNQLGMSDISGARQSLDIYCRRAPEGAHLEDVDQLSYELDLFQTAGRPASRKLYRAMRVANRACDAMKADMPQKACRLFAASLEMVSEQYEMRALYAMALFMAGDEDEARTQADRACGGYPPSVRALCVCAQVFNLLGDRDRAVELMDTAQREQPQGPELRLMIYSAGEMGLYEKAAEYARLALQETPYDRQLLHIRGVALKHSGADDAEAGKCWARILRLDPEDSVAQFYCEAAARGALDDCKLDFSYQVPEQEFTRRLKALSDVFSTDLDVINERWAEDQDFRRLIQWAALSEEVRLGRAAVTTLCLLDDPEAKSVLRALMVDPDVPREVKLQAAALTHMKGGNIGDIMPASGENVGAALVDIDALLSELPVGERQLVRFASEVLEDQYGLRVLAPLAMLWVSYRRTRGTKGDPLKRMEASAGALAYYFLLTGGRRPGIAKLARHFGSTPRQLVFCARRIASAMERRGGHEESTES